MGKQSRGAAKNKRKAGPTPSADSPQPAAPQTGKRSRSRAVHLALIAVLTFLVYADSLGGEFVGDDNVQIARNENIRSLGNIPRDFTTSVWAFASPNQTSNDRYYRPLQNVIYTLTYHVGGLSPVAYHLVSVTLHSAVSIFVYLLCLEMGLSVGASLFAAALFVVHPVHTESVAWIAGVGDLLCGLFYFSGLWAFIRFLKRQSAAWLALSMLLVFLALLSKEMAVTFPLAAILVIAMKRDELHFTIGKSARSIAPFFLVVAVYLAVRLSVLGLTLPATFEDHPGVFDWITLAVWIFGHYLQFAFVPYPLASFHPTPLYLEYRIVSTILYGFLAAGIAGLLWYRRKQIPDGLLWLLMFAAMLAPVFYLKGIAGGNLFAERYLYIPTLPAMVLVAILGSRLKRRTSIVVSICLIAIFSAVTVARNLDWRSDEALYTRTLEIYPNNVYTCLSLSALYLDQKRYSEAEKCLEIAAAHIDDPQFSHPGTEAYRLSIELGTLAARQGKASEAENYLMRAIEINPAASDAYSLLAGVRMNLERKFEESIPLLEKAIELGPADDQARDSMGVALYNLKEYDRAVEYFRQALQINPDSKLAASHLETALKRVQSK